MAIVAIVCHSCHAVGYKSHDCLYSVNRGGKGRGGRSAEAEVVVVKVIKKVVAKVFLPVKAVGSLNQVEEILTTFVSVFVIVCLTIKLRLPSCAKFWKCEKKAPLREI